VVSTDWMECSAPLHGWQQPDEDSQQQHTAPSPLPTVAPGGARKAEQLPSARSVRVPEGPHPHQPVGVLEGNLETLWVAAREVDLCSWF